MKLGTQVGLGIGHIMLRGDPTPPPLKGHSPPIFGPYLLLPNGCMDQDVTWFGGRPRPRRLCVIWDPAPHPQKGGGAFPPIFGPRLLWPNGWIDQDDTWHGASPRSRPHCARWRPSSPPQKVCRAPNFRPISSVAKRLDAPRCHLVWMLASAKGTLC